MGYIVIGAGAEKTLHIGKQGENKVTRIDFTAFRDECLALFGAGTLALAHERQEDSGPYLVALTDGLYWDISSSDVAKPGTGWAELSYTVGNQVKKSLRWKTCTLSALGQTVTPPAAWQSYIDQVTAQVGHVTGMTVSAEAAAGTTPTVTKGTDAQGNVHLTFGLVKGDKGDTGATGATGATGPAGVAVQDEQPTDPAVKVWVDTDPDESATVNVITDGDINLSVLNGLEPHFTPGALKASGITPGSTAYTITSLKVLPSSMSFFTASGAFRFNLRNMAVLDVPVKAGSTVACANDTVEFMTLFAPAGGSASVFNTYKRLADGAYIVPSDGRLSISVRYISSTLKAQNNSIFDNLAVSLKVDPTARFARNAKAIRNIPDFTHFSTVDTSGFNQNTDYTAIQAAFDALCDGYRLKREVLANVVSNTGADGSVTGNADICSYTYNPYGPATHSNNEPKVILVGSMHGHEKSATYGLYYMLREIMQNRGGSDMAMFLSTLKLVIVPAVNPWGWNNNSRFNSSGININRNFGAYSWADYQGEEGKGVAPWEYNAKGSNANDQPETQAILTVLAKHSDAAACIDCHTNGLSTEAPTEIMDFEVSYSHAAGLEGCLADFVSYTKPFIDAHYGVNINTPKYGTSGVNDNKPTLCAYSADGASMSGFLLEVTPGSESGYLGTNLTKYSPGVIRLCGEMTAAAVAEVVAYSRIAGLIK